MSLPDIIVHANPEWTLAEAIKTIRQLTPALEARGWLVAGYGSVFTEGHGRDLDLLVVPKRPGLRGIDAINRIQEIAGGAASILGLAEGLMNSLSSIVTDEHNRLIDIQVRMVYERGTFPSRT